MLRTLLLAALAVSATAQTLSIQKPDRVGAIVGYEFFIADRSHRVVQDNGKYWSRRMIGPGETPLQPGDQFEERNAYVLLRAAKENPLKEFLEWEKKIRAEWSAAR